MGRNCHGQSSVFRKHVRKKHGNTADEFWDPAQRGVRVISCFYSDIRKFFNVWTSVIFLFIIYK